jgi:hypothetical protein
MAGGVDQGVGPDFKPQHHKKKKKKRKETSSIFVFQSYCPSLSSHWACSFLHTCSFTLLTFLDSSPDSDGFTLFVWSMSRKE